MPAIPFFPPSLGNEIFAELCRSLPPPVEPTQAALDARDTIALTHLIALRPADTEEAMLAVRIVAAEAHARDALRLAGTAGDDTRLLMRCRNQAAAMMRTADRARKELRQCQTDRARARAFAATVGALTPAEPAEGAAAEAAPPPEVVRAAEGFALQFPRVAARLRRREDPSQVLVTDLRPEEVPDHAVVQAVIHANSAVLRRLDRLVGTAQVAA